MTTGAPQRRTLQAIFFCLAATVLLTAADLWTKNWAQAELSRQPVVEPLPTCERDERGYTQMQRSRYGSTVLIEGYLEFRYAENCGAAFGMLAEAPRWIRLGVFMSVGAFAIIALSFMFISGTGGPLFAWSVPLIVSGALGNVIDRIRFGYVVDFIRFYVNDQSGFTMMRGFEYPTFNVADITITVGVALLLLDALLYKGDVAQKSPSASAAASPSAQ
jgi:signal peptidase II